MPFPTESAPTGTVIVYAEAERPHGVDLYARVSSAVEQADGERAIGLGSPSWLSRKPLGIVKAIKEVGSKMDGHRRGLIGLLRDPKVGVILVEHRDRLMRFGFE